MVSPGMNWLCRGEFWWPPGMLGIISVANHWLLLWAGLKVGLGEHQKKKASEKKIEVDGIVRLKALTSKRLNLSLELHHLLQK